MWWLIPHASGKGLPLPYDEGSPEQFFCGRVLTGCQDDFERQVVTAVL